MPQQLFDAIHEVEQQVTQAPYVLLCLDYDGTLTHFSATPAGAHLSTQMERVLLSLTECDNASLAIISGRNRADLQGRIEIPGLIYVGNHGLEISGPGFLFIEPTAASHAGALQELSNQLTAKLEPVTGAFVEYKGLTVSVHYRQVPEAQWDEVRRLVHAVLASTSHPFVLTTGEKIFEIRPRVYWNKGSAVGWIKEHLAKPDILTIYVGDDTTDEDAFVAIQDGIAIKVGNKPETAARYTLSGPTEVRKFLEWIGDVLRHKAAHEAAALAAATPAGLSGG